MFYDELPEWWPLFSSPDEYLYEAVSFMRAFSQHATRPIRTMLELGSGGGNNALHMKAHYAMTLVDLAPGMIEVSRRLNPECEHHVGDMRTIRLGRTFDAVFVHDAVMYLTTEADLAAHFATVRAHLAPGGVALFAPDHVRETFEPETDHGGEDANDGTPRGLRYLSWSWDPDPNDTQVVTDYTFVLRDATGALRTLQDRHHEGIFPRETWRRLLKDARFEVVIQPDEWRTDIFLAKAIG